MKPECPDYIPPRHYENPETLEDYESYAMCSLTDKYCIVEHGEPEDCVEYQQFLKENKKENKYDT